jgi:hypothetical protein
LPTPVEVKTLNEWAATELDWKTRQEIAAAQRNRTEARKSARLTKAQRKAQTEAHELGMQCAVENCETCYEQQPEQVFICLAHSLPLLDCPDCDEESPIVLDPEDASKLREAYQVYVDGQRSANREALMAAQEAALFLLLIKKPVQVSIAPAQQAFADLLQLASRAGAEERRLNV